MPTQDVKRKDAAILSGDEEGELRDSTSTTNWRQVSVIRYLGFHQAMISQTIKCVG